MTDREEDIIDAVGNYVDRKFGDDAYDGENYTEKVQDYYDELQERVEDAYNERIVLSPTLLNRRWMLRAVMYKLIKEVAEEMETDQRAIVTLKYHLGLL